VADWDANSPRLTENLVGVLRRARAAAFRRDAPSLEDARLWHRDMMAGLRVPHPSHVARFRGEAGLETYRVRVGVNKGVAPEDVAGALARFEQTLQSAVAALDERYPSGQELETAAPLESGRTCCSCGTGFRLSCGFARGPTTATAKPAPQR
jgi:hypothetical protein